MTIKTPANFTPPPNSGEGQGDGKPLYRKWERSIIDDGQGEVNFADALCKLNDPNSGEALNVNASINGVAPISNFRASTLEGRKVHFEANFDSGFDTLNDFAAVFDQGNIPESRNASSISGNGSIIADTVTSSLLLEAKADGTQQSLIILESKNYIKMPSSGITYLEGQGTFEHVGAATTNTTVFGVTRIGIDTVFSPDFNVDIFDGSGPSGITLDLKKVQTVVLQFFGKNKGDIKLGFLINDTLYFAHVFEINNLADNTKTLNLPVREEIIITNNNRVFRTFGLYNTESGVGFVTDMDTTSNPTLIVEQRANNMVCYTVGADTFEKRVPFVVGNKETYVAVSAANTPLFSVRCADVFSGVVNRSIFNFDQLIIQSSGVDLDHGAYVKVFYNPLLTGIPSFVPIPANAESALEVDFSATGIVGGIEIFSAPIMANQIFTFSADDLYKNYRRQFSRNEILGENVPALVKSQMLTVVASPMPGTPSLNVSSNIFGGEVG